jgi:hypothetical protein
MLEDKFEYTYQMGTFEYMPHTFLGIDTSTFSDSYFPDGRENPFLSLKYFAMTGSVSVEDRMQCVRYMCYIPYTDYIKHCIEAAKTIISEEKYDVYNRFHFFSNNSRYTKLDGHVVFELHPFFFYLALKNRYPLELTLMSARFIISQYDYLSDERNSVLEYILDVADDPNETVYARSECADILITLGEGNEIIFGEQVIEELGDLYNENKEKTIYTNAQNAHNETINENTRNIVRALYKEYLTKFTYKDLITLTLEPIQDILYKICREPSELTLIQHFLYRIMTDPFRFERLSLADILNLVCFKINTLEHGGDAYKRLFEEALDCNETCTTGYFTRIVNTLNGFITDKDLTFYINPRDELRSVIFARINKRIRSLPEKSRDSVLQSLEDKELDTFYEFMELYSPEEELREEYKNLLTEEEFILIYNKCIDGFVGKV